MAAPSLLLDFAVVLIAAEVGGTLFRRMRLPRAVGMLVAGILLGPFTPGYVVDLDGIAGLALLGAVFLMFSTGLSYDIRGFRKLGAWPFVLAGLGVGASFALGLALGLLAGWPTLGALFVGLLLTSTSTTLAVKLLADSGLGGVAGADLITAAIIVDDIAALVLMTVVVGIAAPVPVPPSFLFAGLAAIVGLAVLLILVSRHALPRILLATDRISPSSVVVVAVSLALFVSFGFVLLGMPPFLGAFFAGSIIASTEYGARVSRHMAPVTAIFMGVFFASTGFLIDPARLPGILGLGLAAVGLAVVAKVLPGYAILSRTATPPTQRWALAAVLIPRAEISLIIAQYGASLGLSGDLLALAMAVMIGTALLPSAFLLRVRTPAPTTGA